MIVAKLIACIRGPQNKRYFVPTADIMSRKATVMTGDNLRVDVDGTTCPGGLPLTPEDAIHRFFYGDMGTPDIEFSGALQPDDGPVKGKHFVADGQAFKNLARSNGATVNVKLYAGAPGTTEGAYEFEYRGEKARFSFRVD